MRDNVKTEFIPKFIMLFAGAIVCIISIVKHMDTTYSLEVLLAVLIIFYLIGCLARWIIERVMVSNRFMKEKTDKPDEKDEKAAEPKQESQAQEAKEAGAGL
jgi:uncharacterized membrane protein YqjE